MLLSKQKGPLEKNKETSMVENRWVGGGGRCRGREEVRGRYKRMELTGVQEGTELSKQMGMNITS